MLILCLLKLQSMVFPDWNNFLSNIKTRCIMCISSNTDFEYFPFFAEIVVSLKVFFKVILYFVVRTEEIEFMLAYISQAVGYERVGHVRLWKLNSFVTIAILWVNSKFCGISCCSVNYSDSFFEMHDCFSRLCAPKMENQWSQTWSFVDVVIISFFPIFDFH